MERQTSLTNRKVHVDDSKDSDKWQTPTWLKKHFEDHYDPCPPNHEIDGLFSDWRSPAFVNPPYSNPLEWVKKAIEESMNGCSVVMLLRVDTSTKWFKLLIQHGCHIAFINERLHFNDSKKPANFPSMLVYLDNVSLR